jgi:hypothetical protein
MHSSNTRFSRSYISKAALPELEPFKTVPQRINVTLCVTMAMLLGMASLPLRHDYELALKLRDQTLLPVR